MCKILCVTSHDPAQRNAIILKAWAGMYGQTDGFGAAWFGVDGQIGYFKRSHPRIHGYDGAAVHPMPSFVSKKHIHGVTKTPFAESNDIPSDGGFLIVHGRTATNAVNVHNTHPMVREDAAMVHNGVVQSLKYKNEGDCTCDTQLLLNAFMAGGIPELETEITGYYAFMNLSIEERDGVDTKMLHIVKDRKANLVCGIKPDGSFVFATLEGLVKDMGAEPMGDVEDCSVITFSGPTQYEPTTFTPNVTHHSAALKAQTDRAFGPTGRDYDAMTEGEWEEYVEQRWPEHSKGKAGESGLTPLEEDLKALRALEEAAIDHHQFETAKS